MSEQLDTLPEGHASQPPPPRRPGELTVVELGRWAWRQLTSMRTALMLLLLLALAAIPGSLIPQSGVDSLKTSNWQEDHPRLTPIYERLDLFDVYSSPWFAAIYILLMVSLIGCIVPRLRVYWRALRAQPPATPRHLARFTDHASYVVAEEPEVVLDRARSVLKRQRYRLRAGEQDSVSGPSVSAERGYLREAGNLLFHLSIILVLVGFAWGSLFGYKGGVIVPVGPDYGFTNVSQQYDDLDPGSLFSESRMDPFSFSIDDFYVDWLDTGMARGFRSELSYCRTCDGSDDKSYDLRVNHPLSIGSTEVFLIGHGYAPIVTIRDGDGNITASGPTVFLPQDASFLSYGVVKSQPGYIAGQDETKPPENQIGLEGNFYPTFYLNNGDPATLMGKDNNPLISMLVYAGDLNPSNGPQSVYLLDKEGTTQVMDPDDPSQPLRLDMRVGDTVTLPNGLGSVSFDGVAKWNRLQISQSPGKRLALGGVVLCLIGLLGSLFIRPRRVWVRARRTESGDTMVEVAALDRSGGGDTETVVRELVDSLQKDRT
ncbi:cytochrome c biogenesis protein ResB [Nocardioides sp.]|uniref:cytochrome c biogenesis protein ResB n=1 Tax=Nocardioides sp. TaxID=35761 RepID=UPI0039E33F8F